MNIITEAREWIDTPFRHQGRTKGVEADCAGLIVGLAEAYGATGDYIDRTDYPRTPDGSMRDILNVFMDRKRAIDQAPGDVLFFAFCRIPQHLAILTESNTIIHAYEPAGKVTEHIYDDTWRRMVRGVYGFRVN